MKLMRQVGSTSLGDDACETLTIAGLAKAKERNLEQFLRLRAPQTWVVLCASADQYLRRTVDSSATQPTPMDINAVVSTSADCGRSGHEKSKCPMRNETCGICGKVGLLRRSAGSVRRVMVKEKRRQVMAKERTRTRTSATVVVSQVTESPTAVIAMTIAAHVGRRVTRARCAEQVRGQASLRAVEVDSEDTGEDPIKEIHDVWAVAVCTSTEHTVHETREDNLSMIKDSGAEEHVVTRADWQRFGEPLL